MRHVLLDLAVTTRDRANSAHFGIGIFVADHGDFRSLIGSVYALCTFVALCHGILAEAPLLRREVGLLCYQYTPNV